MEDRSRHGHRAREGAGGAGAGSAARGRRGSGGGTTALCQGASDHACCHAPDGSPVARDGPLHHRSSDGEDSPALSQPARRSHGGGWRPRIWLRPSQNGRGKWRGVRVRALASGMVRLEITLQADDADLVVKAIEKARDELRVQALARTRSSDCDCKRTAVGTTAEDETDRSPEADVGARDETPVGSSLETGFHAPVGARQGMKIPRKRPPSSRPPRHFEIAAPTEGVRALGFLFPDGRMD
jgi:hypothetical protein